ncbi:MAG TPA: acyltransferase, partial [Candidatus Methylacidiphilales bacterium]|nr:acyltransferase [Candidatus Methylacidiphilales bacterium]
MNELSHYRYIDALRGFAFLGVLSIHSAQECPHFQFPGCGMILAGMYGVQLFFLLSAVTLCRSMMIRSAKERFPIRNFFIRRFFRIAPLFWFAIVYYFLMDGTGPRYWAPHGLAWWHFVATAFFVHGWTPTSIDSVVPGGWSIGVEMTFYLCLPFLARRITSLWSGVSAAFFAIVAALILNRIAYPILSHFFDKNEDYLVSSFLIYWFPSQLPVFLIGIALFFCLQNETLKRTLASPERPVILLLMAAYGYVALSRHGSGPVPPQVGYAGVFALVILALKMRPLALFVNPLTCGLGTISFSCYITHFTALTIAAKFLESQQFGFLPLKLASFLHFLAIWIVGLIITVIISSVTYWS